MIEFANVLGRPKTAILALETTLEDALATYRAVVLAEAPPNLPPALPPPPPPLPTLPVGHRWVSVATTKKAETAADATSYFRTSCLDGTAATAAAVPSNALDMTFDMMPGLLPMSERSTRHQGSATASFAVWEKQEIQGSGCDGRGECPYYISVLALAPHRMVVAKADGSETFNRSATFHVVAAPTKLDPHAFRLVSALTGNAVSIDFNMTGMLCVGGSVGALVACSTAASSITAWTLVEPWAAAYVPAPPTPAELPAGTGGLTKIAQEGMVSSVQSSFAFIVESGAAREGTEFEGAAASLLNELLSDEPNCLYVNCFTTRAHLTGGMTGLKPMIEALIRLNRTEELIEVFAQDTWPSLGFHFEMGATALWESPISIQPPLDKGAAVCGPGSLSGGWLVLFAKYYFTGLAGIQQLAGSAGFRELRLRPAVPWRQQAVVLSNLTAQQETPLGTVRSAWVRRSPTQLEYEAQVPPLATALVFVPTLHLAGVTVREEVSSTVVWAHGKFQQAPGLLSAELSHTGSSGAITFRVVSGTYRFAVEGQPGRWTCANASTLACATPTLVCDSHCPIVAGSAEIRCRPGERVLAIAHASFAAPLPPWATPSCAAGTDGPSSVASKDLRCAAGSAQYVVEKQCLGKESCSVAASEALFDPPGQTVCKLMSGSRQLIIHAVCGKN